MLNKVRRLSWALVPISVLALSGCGSTQQGNHNPLEQQLEQSNNELKVSGSLTKEIPMTYTPRVFGRTSPFGEPINITAEVLNRSSNSKDAISKFGGRLDKTYQSTGYFHTSYIDERWWLIDPEGHPMIHVGLNSTESVGSPENSIMMMKVMGFNSTGAFTKKDVERITDRMPSTPKLKCMESFGSAFYGASSNGNNYDFENRVIPILDPRFEQFCFDRLSKSVKSSKVNDPYIIGYYVDNELPWRVDSLDRMLTLSTGNISKEKAQAWLASNGGVVNDETRSKFLYFITDRYYSIVQRALKNAAPNHLYLGSRLHARYKTNEDVVRAAGNHVDVLSVNFYGPWKPTEEHFSLWTEWANKPVIISEWYTKANSTGLHNGSGAGHILETQLERGYFYQDFTISLLKSDVIVGWSWHRFIDQQPGPVGATSNKGILDKNGVAYLDLAQKAKEVNDQVYYLIDEFNQQP